MVKAVSYALLAPPTTLQIVLSFSSSVLALSENGGEHLALTWLPPRVLRMHIGVSGIWKSALEYSSREEMSSLPNQD